MWDIKTLTKMSFYRNPILYNVIRKDGKCTAWTYTKSILSSTVYELYIDSPKIYTHKI